MRALGRSSHRYRNLHCHNPLFRRQRHPYFLQMEVSRMINNFIYNEDGQTLVEYGLLITLIALVVVTTLTFLGQRLRSGYSAAVTGIGTST